MIKFALAALIATSAPAMAIDLKTNVNALINMAAASLYCGMKIPENIAYDMLMETAIEGDVDEEMLASAVDAKAEEFGRKATPQQLRRFCAEMKIRYRKIGVNPY